MTTTMTERIAVRAVEVRPARVLLSILAAPFYLLGFVVAVVFVALVWCWAAVGVGFSDVKNRKAGDAG